MSETNIDRRAFIEAATSAGAAVALTGIGLGAGAAVAASPSSNTPTKDTPITWYSGPDPGIPKVGLRWAFSATVFSYDSEVSI